jgi:hypothetical protein
MRGGIDAIYDELPKPIGLGAFAPVVPARGRMFSARRRLGRQEDPVAPPPIAESELYPESGPAGTPR